MKVIYEHELGADGGKAGLYADEGMIKFELGYPIAKLVDPIMAKLEPLKDKIESIIPGTWDKPILDKAFDDLKAEIVKLLSV